MKFWWDKMISLDVFNHWLEWIAAIISLCITGGLVFYNHAKRIEKLSFWSVMAVVVIGMFSFSFPIHVGVRPVRIPIIPLGVGILYFYFQRKQNQWKVFGVYAWLGYLFNVFLLILTLISIPIHQTVYPNKLSTYIANPSEASIVLSQPSGHDVSLNKENLIKLINSQALPSLESGLQWMKNTSGKQGEWFPYMVTDALPKWGSDANAIIYIEKDGKGILVTTRYSQYYFRSNNSLISSIH